MKVLIKTKPHEETALRLEPWIFPNRSSKIEKNVQIIKANYLFEVLFYLKNIPGFIACRCLLLINYVDPTELEFLCLLFSISRPRGVLGFIFVQVVLFSHVVSNLIFDQSL